SQRSYGTACRPTGDKLLNGRPQGSFFNARGFANRVHSGLADAARRQVQYAQQRNVILRMHGEAHVGERILHFGPIVKAESADEFVTQASPAKNLFEGARLEIGAVFHGAGLVRIVVEDAL